MSLLEQFWAQAKNLVLAFKCLKIYKHKIQTSHPHCRSLKWVKIGSVNNIFEFLVCTASLGLLEYTLVNRTCCHSCSVHQAIFFQK